MSNCSLGMWLCRWGLHGAYYSMIGSAHIRTGTIIGSRVSITSGKNQHQSLPGGGWGPFDAGRVVRVGVGPGAWVGEGALVMAGVGQGSLVGAGAVVTAAVSAYVVVAGNPARMIRELPRPLKEHGV